MDHKPAGAPAPTATAPSLIAVGGGFPLARQRRKSKELPDPSKRRSAAPLDARRERTRGLRCLNLPQREDLRSPLRWARSRKDGGRSGSSLERRG